MKSEEGESAPAAGGESPAKRVARNSSWMLGAQLVTAALALLQAVFLTHLLGLRNYGAYVLVTTVVLGTVQLLDSRLFETITRYVPLYRERNQPERADALVRLCFAIEAAAALGAFLLVLVASDWAAERIVKDASLAGGIALYAWVALLLVPHEPCSALLRVAGRFETLARFQVASAALGALLLGAAAFAGAGVTAVLGLRLVSVGASSLALLFLARGACADLGLQPLRRMGKGLAEERASVLRFILHSHYTATSRLVSQRADLLLLGVFGTPAAVGAYEVAKRVVHQLESLATPLYVSLFPEMSALQAKGDTAALARLRHGVTRTVLAGVLPVCLVASLIAPPLLVWAFGSEFEPSAPLFRVLVWQLLALPLLWFPGYLLSLGKARSLAATTAADAVIFLLLLLVAIPVAGAWGAALASLARALIWVALALYVMRGVARDEARDALPAAGAAS